MPESRTVKQKESFWKGHKSDSSRLYLLACFSIGLLQNGAEGGTFESIRPNSILEKKNVHFPGRRVRDGQIYFKSCNFSLE